jgi:RNA polymerase subunit RPABC4/transcription elongation factor Spt4
VSPIDYRCRECGASLEVGVGSLLTDDYQPDCPACESEDVQTDWDAVVNRFVDPANAVVEPLAAVKMPAREV